MDNPDNEWIEDIKKQAENLTAMTNSLVSRQEWMGATVI